MNTDELGQYCDLLRKRLQIGERVSLEQFLEDNQLPDDERLCCELRQIYSQYSSTDAALPQDGTPAETHEQHTRVTEENIDATLSQSPPEVGLSTHTFVLDETISYQGSVPDDSTNPLVEAPPLPARYQIDRILGKGQFGRVFLVTDAVLKRQVAVKVPHDDAGQGLPEAAHYIAEAQMQASLDHPNIVPVYNAEQTADGHCFIVSKYIPGTDLKKRVELDSLPSQREVAALVAKVSSALHHSHEHGLVHRDIKPANILVDGEGTPFVADFGIALAETAFGTGPRVVGSLAYMSPEQARGEGHRVDCRSDVFGVGVVLYELLTGRRPFRGKNWDAVAEQIALADPTPLREINETIHPDLERICLKALAKLPSDRYQTAADLAADLREFLEPKNRDKIRAKHTVVPKALRSFDTGDADFFLDLLPGVRDQDGLPESIRSWIQKVDVDFVNAFRVAVVYGPSGCGKSSFIRAGLLPRLTDRIKTVYVEASPQRTEASLLKAVRWQCPGLPEDVDLTNALASIRSGDVIQSEKKFLIVIDQFEQWLHSCDSVENSVLSKAMRECDGQKLQCILLIRDDFWMQVTRFMHSLNIAMVDGENCVAIDLFGLPHAKKVLTEFGRAFNTLPADPMSLTEGQNRFLDEAVSGLAVAGKVIPVRLAAFSETVRRRSWTPATIHALGGMDGIGVTFLEEMLGDDSLSLKNREHVQAARRVLKSLLPDHRLTIRGHVRSRRELQAASGYEDDAKFDELMAVLVNELRLVVVHATSGDHDESTEEDVVLNYQLTHDYLVRPLWVWLTSSGRKTLKGRAEVWLAEQATFWNAKPIPRYLPTLFEWIAIKGLTRQRYWNPLQRKMMKAADRYYLARLAFAVILAVVGIGGGRLLWWKASGPDVPDQLKSVSVVRPTQVSGKAAIEAYRRRLVLSPQDHYARNGLRRTLQQQAVRLSADGQLQEAAKSLNEAWSLAPDLSTKKSVIAAVESDVALLESLCEKLPGEALLSVASAQAAVRSGDYERARQINADARSRVEQRLVKDSDDAEAAEALAELLLLDLEEWQFLEPMEMKSAGGATLKQLDDGSILASGENPQSEIYEVVAEVEMKSLAALRLEAIPHPSLTRGGYGRSDNGNVCLSEVEAEISQTGEGDQWASLRLTEAVSNNEASTTKTAYAIDGDLTTHWSTWQGVGPSIQNAVFRLEAPQPIEGRVRLRVRLRFASPWYQHQFGRFRLSISEDVRAVEREHQRIDAMKLTASWSKLRAALRWAGEEHTFERIFGAAEKEWEQAWQDPPLDPLWEEPASVVVDKIQQADGMVRDRFAFCQTMQLNEFEAVVNALRKSGYRPIRVRPYRHNSEVQVAAAWTRDSRDWRMSTNLSVDDIRQANDREQEANFLPVDAAGYLSGQPGQESELYVAIWRENDTSAEYATYFGVEDKRHKDHWQPLMDQGLGVMTRQLFGGADGMVKHSLTWRKPKIDGGSFWSGRQVFYESKIGSNFQLDADVGSFPGPDGVTVRYAGVFAELPKWESQEFHGLSPTEHLAKCQMMQSLAYRISAISVTSVDGDLLTASVWHHPTLPPKRPKIEEVLK